MSILATLGVKPTKGKSSPAITANEGLSEAAEFIASKERLDAAEADAEVRKGPLYDIARRLYLASNAGRPIPVDAVEFPTPAGTVRASILNAYAAPIPAIALLPTAMVRERFTIKLDGDTIPAETAGAFVADLQALAAKYGVPLSAKGGLYPVPTFNTRRHVELSPEVNASLEAAGLGTRITLRVSR